MLICPSCAASNQAGADNCLRCGKGLYALTIGSVLADRYEITGALGRGGMGMVYQATDKALNEVVAVKILRPDVASSDDVHRRFRNELRLARRVTHRNVCRMFEYGQVGHLSYLVMEFVSGVDLKHIIRERGGFSPQEAYEIADEVCEALGAIHAVGIIHRDLKTPNIMRDVSGRLKLMDFGIAKRLESDTAAHLTATGHIVGTPEYMSPEQARGMPLDIRSDLYAMGIVVYELFTGQVPFRGDTPVATLFMHIQEEVPLEGSKAARLPASVRPVLKKALAKDRNNRFSSAAALAEALREARARPHSTEQDRVSAASERGPLTVSITDREGPQGNTSATLPTVIAHGSRRPLPRTLRLPLMALGATSFAVALGLTARTLSHQPSSDERSSLTKTAMPAPTPVSPGVPAQSAERTHAPPAQASHGPSHVPVALTATATTAPPSRMRTAANDKIAIARAPVDPVPTPLSWRRLPDPLESVQGPESPAPLATAPAPAPNAIAPQARGEIELVIHPWGDVSVDGANRVAVTRPTQLSLPPGTYSLQFFHPDYEPVPRKVTVVSGSLKRIELDFRLIGRPKRD